MDITIVFVEPESKDNVGALARVMANFGFKKLIIINPKVPVYSEKVKIVARKKGWEIINNALIFDDLKEVVEMFDLTYGTTGIAAKRGSDVLRNPLTPEELAKKIWNYEGKVGIFFGREASGFTNEELNLFDATVTIPASEEYPVMNITHAAAIILYELFKYKNNPVRKTFKLMSKKEKDSLIKLASELINLLPVQDYKKSIMVRVVRNLIGKAILSQREYSVLAGIFHSATDLIKNCISKK